MLSKFPVKEIWELLSNQKKVTICTHINPDGDTIGSAIALRDLLLENTDIKEVRISGSDVPPQFKFIASDIEDNIEDEFFFDSQVIVVDTSNKNRVWDKRVVTKEAIRIDHHKDQEEWKMKIGGDYWPACGEIIAEMALMLDLKISNKAKNAISIAILTDTEYFTQRNISSNTFRIMSEILKNDFDYLGIVTKTLPNTDEIEKINHFMNKVKFIDNITLIFTKEVIPNSIYRQLVSSLSSIRGQEVTLFVGKEENAENFRCGVRTKGHIDASKIAEAFGGGGHHTSAGFKLNLDVDEKKFIEKIQQIIGP